MDWAQVSPEPRSRIGPQPSPDLVVSPLRDLDRYSRQMPVTRPILPDAAFTGPLTGFPIGHGAYDGEEVGCVPVDAGAAFTAAGEDREERDSQSLL